MRGWDDMKRFREWLREAEEIGKVWLDERVVRVEDVLRMNIRFVEMCDDNTYCVACDVNEPYILRYV